VPAAHGCLPGNVVLQYARFMSETLFALSHSHGNYTLEVSTCLLRAHAVDSTGDHFSLALKVLRHEKGCVWPRNCCSLKTVSLFRPLSRLPLSGRTLRSSSLLMPSMACTKPRHGCP